ncbi:MAG: hypothetical protein FJ264_07930 [Planctomycetes bacterium]|nr:hypothetical protein [Planctomycetota bacterium]
MVSASWLRKNQKIVYIIMIFAVSVWGISYSAMELIPKKPIGKVLGRKVTQDEFADMAIRWQRLFFPQTQESVVPMIWKQLMMVEKANQMGLMITSPEVEDGLRRIAFQIFGQNPDLDRQRLIQFLCNTFKLNPDQIQRTIREALLVEKLEVLLRASAKVTSEELWHRFSLENEQVKLKILALKASDFADSVQVNEEELVAFYNEYKNKEYDGHSGTPGYMLPEMVKIECLVARFNDMESLVTVAEEDIKKYYEDNKETQYKIDSSETKTEAPDAQEEKTDATAKDDTKEKDIKKTTYKLYAEVKDEIQKTLSRQKAREKASEVINKVDEEIYATIDKADRQGFIDLARKYKLTHTIPTGKESKGEFLTEKDLWEIFPGSDQIVNVAFDREKFEPSMPLEFVEGIVIVQVIDKKYPAPAPFEDIKNKVAQDLAMVKGLQKSKEVAEKYLTGSYSASAFDDIVKLIKTEYGKKDFLVCETDYINRPAKLFERDSRYIEALNADRPNIAKKAFELKEGEVSFAIETTDEKACYIITVIERKPADKSLFEKTRETVKKRFLYEKQEAFLTAWKADMDKHMEIYTKFQ